MSAKAATNDQPWPPVSSAHMTFEAPMMNGTERSKPPSSTTSVCPSAAIPSSDASTSMARMLGWLL